MEKNITLIMLLVFGICNVNALNMSFDSGHYQFKLNKGSGEFVGIYVNESVNLEYNDYILTLEERPLNMTYVEMLDYPLNLIEDNVKVIVILVVILMFFTLFVLLFTLWRKLT